MAISITVKIDITKKQVEVIRAIGTDEIPSNSFVTALHKAVNTLIKRDIIRLNEYHHKTDHVELTDLGILILKQL